MLVTFNFYVPEYMNSLWFIHVYEIYSQVKVNMQNKRWKAQPNQEQ